MKSLPWIVAALGLAAAFAWGGPAALVIAALLSIMEVSLSFDNAVVNAAVLRRMDPKWQQRFLTWGILIAVFGMRLVFPVLIVAIAAGQQPRLTLDPREPVETMTAYIVQVAKGDTPTGTLEYRTIFVVAATLFVITFVANVASFRLARRYRGR